MRALLTAAVILAAAVPAAAQHADHGSTLVQTFERVPMLNTNGIVGLRIGHHVNVHVTDLSVEPISR